MKSRTLLMMLLLWLAATGAWAQKAIAVWQKDGTVAKFAFAEKPVVTYSATELVLTTTKTSVHYPINLLQKIDFNVDDTSTDVKDVDISSKGSLQFSFRDGVLTVSGGEAGATVKLYQLNGVVAGQYSLDGNGYTTIPTGNLSRDVYIVKTKQFSFKFRKP